MMVILLLVSVPMMIGGAVVLAGGADRYSGVGRMSQPVAAGLALLLIGVLCGTAALLVRRDHRLALPAATTAAFALGAIAVYRFLADGVFGIPAILVPPYLAVLISRSRSKATEPPI